MIIALYFLPNSEKTMLSKYDSIISQWINPEMKKILQEAIDYHLKDDNWRLIN